MGVELIDKKDYILSAVASGLSFLQAAALSSCTPEDIETLKSDRDFMAHLEYRLIEEEQALLELHSDAIRVAARRGSTTGIQWKLAKLNPQKWGDGREMGDGESLISDDTVDFSDYSTAQLRRMRGDTANTPD